MSITMIIKVIKILLEHCLFLLITIDTNLPIFFYTNLPIFLLWFLLWKKKLQTEDQLQGGAEGELSADKY